MSEIVYQEPDWRDHDGNYDVPETVVKPIRPGTCIDCGDDVKLGAAGTYREVKGWERLRQGGGANAITLRKETGALMCAVCGERRKMQSKHHISPEQTSLI